MYFIIHNIIRKGMCGDFHIKLVPNIFCFDIGDALNLVYTREVNLRNPHIQYWVTIGNA